MPSDDGKTEGPAAGATKPRLPARVFYGLILSGVVLGASLAALGGWAYLAFDDRKPTGRRIWVDARDFVIPVAVMMGATFGGVLGFAAAAVWDRRRGRGAAADSRQRGRLCRHEGETPPSPEIAADAHGNRLDPPAPMDEN